jgi:hypothetical protein
MSSLRFPAGGVWLWSLLLVLAGCTDKYTPDVISAPQSFLVVDGFINSQGVTTIQLSRTFTVASKDKPPVETRATLAIEEQAGRRFALLETDKGTYTSADLNLSPGKNYRLLITTRTGQQYASDFVPAQITPPIDAADWRLDNNGLGIYVSTHDETNSTHYYRWKYEETWEIIPAFNPDLEFYDNRIRPIRVPLPRICWGTEKSADIKLDKTTALSQDIVSDYVLRRLPRATSRLYRRYSILVQQQALTKEEYAYWDLLRKNTESIGTLFDPQPSQLTGNVHCLSNEAELAFGFVGAHSLEQQRIFIARSQLPFDWPYISGYEACLPPDTATGNIIPLLRTGLFVPLNEFPAGVTVSTPDCVDCRLRGTSVKPSFW